VPRDEYDDGYDRRPASNSNKTLLIVLGVLGGLLLVAVLACGGLFYFGFRTAKDVVGNMTAAAKSAENYLSELQAGDAAAAYRSMSQRYRSATTHAEFEQFLAQNKGLLKHTGRSSSSFNMNSVNGATQYVAKYTITGPTAGAFCTLTLVEENGAWVVDSITVP